MWGIPKHIWFFVSELHLTICIMGVHRPLWSFSRVAANAGMLSVRSEISSKPPYLLEAFDFSTPLVCI